MKCHPLSAASLYVEFFYQGKLSTQATAFLVKRKGDYYLLTNRHHVIGISKQDSPDVMTVYFNRANKSGKFSSCSIPLLNIPSNWYEHPILGKKGDFVAFKSPADKTITTSPCYDLDTFDKTILFTPGCRLALIGFPYPRQLTGHSALWITGYLASDMALKKALFYIHVRTKKGQEGAPVVFFRDHETISLKNGSTRFGTCCSHLMGIYSGHLSEESDIGIVWKRNMLCELIDSIP